MNLSKVLWPLIEQYVVVFLHFIDKFLNSMLLLLLGQTVGLGDIIYAVNCGGDEHTDVFGIKYQKDNNKVGEEQKEDNTKVGDEQKYCNKVGDEQKDNNKIGANRRGTITRLGTNGRRTITRLGMNKRTTTMYGEREG